MILSVCLGTSSIEDYDSDDDLSEPAWGCCDDDLVVDNKGRYRPINARPGTPFPHANFPSAPPPSPADLEDEEDDDCEQSYTITIEDEIMGTVTYIDKPKHSKKN